MKVKKNKVIESLNTATSKITKFIKDNSLDFLSENSDLNGNCTVIAGFCCYLNEKYNIELNENLIVDIIKDEYETSEKFKSEFLKCYSFAMNNNYSFFWNTKEASKLYIY